MVPPGAAAATAAVAAMSTGALTAAGASLCPCVIQAGLLSIPRWQVGAEVERGEPLAAVDTDAAAAAAFASATGLSSCIRLSFSFFFMSPSSGGECECEREREREREGEREREREREQKRDRDLERKRDRERDRECDRWSEILYPLYLGHWLRQCPFLPHAWHVSALARAGVYVEGENCSRCARETSRGTHSVRVAGRRCTPS